MQATEASALVTQANTVPATFWALAFLLLPQNQRHRQQVLASLQHTPPAAGPTSPPSGAQVQQHRAPGNAQAAAASDEADASVAAMADASTAAMASAAGPAAAETPRHKAVSPSAFPGSVSQKAGSAGSNMQAAVNTESAYSKCYNLFD